MAFTWNSRVPTQIWFDAERFFKFDLNLICCRLLSYFSKNKFSAGLIWCSSKKLILEETQFGDLSLIVQLCQNFSESSYLSVFGTLRLFCNYKLLENHIRLHHVCKVLSLRWEFVSKSSCNILYYNDKK